MEALENKIEVVKLYRHAQGAIIEDRPFDPEVDGWTFKVPLENYYSLEECYDHLEKNLLASDAALLREALVSEMGLGTPDFEIQSISINLIQWGNYQGIFEIGCSVVIEGESEPRDFALVAGISRHKNYNDYVRKDHQMMLKLRADEASHFGLAEDDPKYLEVGSFPKHYGDCDHGDEKPYFYLAPFLKDFYELNLYFKQGGVVDGVSRRLNFNGINQKKDGGLIDESRSIHVLRQIIEFQLGIAARLQRVFVTRMNSGDFMYSPKAKKLLLHTHRQESESTFGPEMAESFEVSMTAAAVAFQIFVLITAAEGNLPGPKEYDEARGKRFFVFPTASIAEVLMESRFRKSLLTQAQWSEVTKAMNFTFEAVMANLKEGGMADGDLLRRLHQILGVMTLFNA